jgi:hypothetical protein
VFYLLAVDPKKREINPVSILQKKFTDFIDELFDRMSSLDTEGVNKMVC